MVSCLSQVSKQVALVVVDLVLGVVFNIVARILASMMVKLRHVARGRCPLRELVRSCKYLIKMPPYHEHDQLPCRTCGRILCNSNSWIELPQSYVFLPGSVCLRSSICRSTVEGTLMRLVKVPFEPSFDAILTLLRPENFLLVNRPTHRKNNQAPRHKQQTSHHTS